MIAHHFPHAIFNGALKQVALTSTVAVNGILAKHVELSIFSDNTAAAVVAGGVHRGLGLEFDHLFGFVGLWLSPALC